MTTTIVLTLVSLAVIYFLYTLFGRLMHAAYAAGEQDMIEQINKQLKEENIDVVVKYKP